MLPSSSSTEADGDPPLLRLPAELRNMIYTLVVTRDDPVRTLEDGKTYPEPELLATCRQIRQEARSVYYATNTFYCRVRDLDATTVFEFVGRSSAHAKAGLRFGFGGKANWSNLKTWLKFTYDTVVGGVAGHEAPAFSGRYAYIHGTVMCFEVMEKLKRKGWSWTEVEDVLEDLHRGMKHGNAVWT